MKNLQEPRITFESVDIRSELQSRPSRLPAYEGEHLALAVLATEMADNPRNLLQKLVEVALSLCQADTAGISLLEGEVFRWEALAGVLASQRRNTMPRDASPSGVCIDQDATQLMYLADRCFPALTSEPRFVEALLVPFHHHGKPIGTVWIAAHGYERKFDREDERILKTLARFAAAGWAYDHEAESSRNKDQFLAMLGHELRNPVAAILTANNVLQNLGIDDFKAVRAIGVVARQSQHVGRMVDDLIDLTRVAHGKLKLQKEPVDLRAVIEQSVETIRTQMERRRHRLSITIPAAPIILNADPVRLAQLLSNLLDNAAKYTGDGGEIWLAVELADHHVSIAIRDNGLGIPKDHIDSIFDLFTQLDESPTSSSKGLGMGLALVRTLVELHGGTVEAQSEGLGRGSLFMVRLPIPPASTLKSQASGLIELPLGSMVGQRILLVEDNVDLAECMTTLLAMDGHTLGIAQDGATALAMLRTFAPDLVLLDLGLPGIDGYQVARKMRAESRKANLVIIALSGYGENEHRRLSLEAGCDDHLVKPVQLSVLRNLLGSNGVYPDRPPPLLRSRQHRSMRQSKAKWSGVRYRDSNSDFSRSAANI